METGDQPPVKSDGPSIAYEDLSASQLMANELPSGVSVDAGFDAASYVSNVSFTASGNITDPSGNPRPSHRVVPPDEPGTHQVTFTVTISIAFTPSETALHMHTKNMFLIVDVFIHICLFV